MKIKAYTDIQQGRKLAEILPIESADMHYKVNRYNDKSEIYLTPYPKLGYYKDNDFEYCVPCWSLDVLMKLLPEKVTVINKNNYTDYMLNIFKENDEWTIYYEEKVFSNEIIVQSCEEHLLNTAYNIIVKLHNKELL